MHPDPKTLALQSQFRNNMRIATFRLRQIQQSPRLLTDRYTARLRLLGCKLSQLSEQVKGDCNISEVALQSKAIKDESMEIALSLGVS